MLFWSMCIHWHKWHFSRIYLPAEARCLSWDWRNSECFGENIENFNSNSYCITRSRHFSVCHIFFSFCQDFYYQWMSLKPVQRVALKDSELQYGMKKRNQLRRGGNRHKEVPDIKKRSKILWLENSRNNEKLRPAT